MRKEYLSPEIDLLKFNFERILEENMHPSDVHIPKEDGDEGLDE